MNASVIKHPIVSEQALRATEQGKYTFLVEKNATKPEIKKAVARQYKVHPTSVAIVNIPPKTRRFRTNISEKPGYKKAIVTLKKGEKLDILPT